MLRVTHFPTPLDGRPVPQAAGVDLNDVLEGTQKFGILRATRSFVQAESNACDVSSTRSVVPCFVTTNNRDQEV